jgi:hypothetical protein
MANTGQKRKKHFNNSALKDFVVSSIKETKIDGRRYVYHRASGARLPDKPFDDPEFTSAFLDAERDHQNATAAKDKKLITRPAPIITETAPPVTPDAIVYTVTQIVAWLHRARSGDVCYYHFGSLQIDATSEDVAEKRSYVRLMAEFGAVMLRQRRSDENVNHYYAIRTDEQLAHLPRNVVTGTVTADEYVAIMAISERQAAVSVARSIRDALGIDDHAAAEIRNSFIRRGWLTNGRPPQITIRGESVLI